MKNNFSSILFDNLKISICEEFLRFYSSDSFDRNASPRDFYNNVLDIIDALDSVKSDFCLVINKFTK